jgi:hypothetical protein
MTHKSWAPWMPSARAHKGIHESMDECKTPMSETAPDFPPASRAGFRPAPFFSWMRMCCSGICRVPWMPSTRAHKGIHESMGECKPPMSEDHPDDAPIRRS